MSWKAFIYVGMIIKNDRFYAYECWNDDELENYKECGGLTFTDVIYIANKIMKY